jgi:hypothetical protein
MAQQKTLRVRNSSDGTEAREACIAAKRLRYLMEPLARAHDDHLGADAAHLSVRNVNWGIMKSFPN